MNIAIILAGGTGTRMGNNLPKQFLTVDGKTILEHTVDVFEKNPLIDEIAIVVDRNYFLDVESIINNNRWQKVKKILQGGKKRFESSFSAIYAYKQFPGYNLIFHDAVRPLVSHRIINDVVKALEKYNAVGVAIPVTDTIYQVDTSQHFIQNIPHRFFLQSAQTPQGFKTGTIQKAYQIALTNSDFQPTDDCGVVEKYLPEEKIYLVRGEETNIKLTYKEDFIFLQLQKKLGNTFS
jgi:2-C-methyl-D-erythritol 4-phosphate cytidylyltransferase